MRRMNENEKDHFLLFHNKAGQKNLLMGREMRWKTSMIRRIKMIRRIWKMIRMRKMWIVEYKKDAEGNEERMKTCSLQRSWRMFVRHEGVLCLKLGGLRQQR